MTEHLSLTHDGVDMYDYPATIRQHVAQAAEAWKQFLALDQPTKDQFAAASLQSGTGYEQKGSGQRESSDIKENFDLTRTSLVQLAEQSHGNPVALHFIAAAGELFDSLEHLITIEGVYIQGRYGVKGFADESAASATSAFVRFLQYPPVPAGTVIGKPHVDHSGFTFHLYESTGGCERLDPTTRQWLPMPVAKHQAAMFGSMQTQLFSQSEIKGLCHRIIANETTAKIGRTAIVCFVPLTRTPRYDRATHGRLQDITPGFNYDMSHEKFEKLFVN